MSGIGAIGADTQVLHRNVAWKTDFGRKTELPGAAFQAGRIANVLDVGNQRSAGQGDATGKPLKMAPVFSRFGHDFR